jgi:hypothetical protein
MLGRIKEFLCRGFSELQICGGKVVGAFFNNLTVSCAPAFIYLSLKELAWCIIVIIATTTTTTTIM